MALKTFVKVGGITNLSDARYCAGMGVDLLGFSVCSETPNYIDPKTFQEIRGWVSGPKVVVEIHGTIPDLTEVITQYAPDYLEVTWDNFLQLREKTELPFIIYTADAKKVETKPEEYLNIAYWIIDAVATKKLETTAPLLIKVTSAEQVDKIINNTEVSGVVLEGSPEIRPGFKNYDALSEILERLDVD